MIAILAASLLASNLSPADSVAVFKAAGAVRHRGGWAICTEDPNGGASIEQVRDLNGDGTPEAIVADSGTFCYGNTGTGFTLLSKQANGRWAKIYDDTGVAEFLKTKGVGGWPDISVGGPGFCFPVLRWNGKTYVQNRREYQGRRCR